MLYMILTWAILLGLSGFVGFCKLCKNKKLEEEIKDKSVPFLILAWVFAIMAAVTG